MHDGARWIYNIHLLPDTPFTTNAWHLTTDERKMAHERVLKAGKAPPVKITFATFKWIFHHGSGMHLPLDTLYVADTAFIPRNIWPHDANQLTQTAIWRILWRQWLLCNLA